MKVKIDRVGVCMGDDAIDHRWEIEMPDNATSADLLQKVLEMGYLPPQTDALWYMKSLTNPCIIVYSVNESKVVAEVKDNALSQLGGKWQSYDFEYYCYPEDVERFKQEVREMDNMVYDKEFFN